MPRMMDISGHVGKLREFLRREGRLPLYGEMLTLFGYRCRIRATPLLSGSVRVLGAVQAGFPSPAEEELADTMSLDEMLIRRPEATFILTVQGDSMTGAGIMPGDMVLVEKGGTPKPQDIVVAQVDDEWTLKYYMKDSTGVRLDAANPRYPSIRPKRSMSIGGIVKAVIRKYA